MRDRSWFSPVALLAWVGTVLVLFFGGFVGWTALGALCEDVGAAGSDEFCKHGGWETAGLVFASLLVLGILVPAAALALCRKRLFWTGLVGPVLLAILNFLLAPGYGHA